MVFRLRLAMSQEKTNIAALEQEKKNHAFASKFHGWRMGKIEWLRKRIDDLIERSKHDLDPRIQENLNRSKKMLVEYQDWQMRVETLVSEFATSLPKNSGIDLRGVARALKERNESNKTKTRRKNKIAKNQSAFDF